MRLNAQILVLAFIAVSTTAVFTGCSSSKQQSASDAVATTATPPPSYFQREAEQQKARLAIYTNPATIAGLKRMNHQ
jgi:hypothetical protein